VGAIAVTATVCRRSATAEGEVIPSDVARRRAGLFLTMSWLNPDIADVSMVQLIATPERFHGTRVRFTGFVHLAFEGNGIYLHEEDFGHGIANEALWIDGSAGSRLNDAYVLVEGTFRADAHGHMGLFSGTLADVTRMDRAFADVLRDAADGGAP
jgi:hypothetical protein